MSDLLTVLPSFDARPFTHILPKLEKALVSCSDLLTLDALHVAKRAQLPASEVKKLADALVQSLSGHAVSPTDPSDPLPASGEPHGDRGLDSNTTGFRSGDALLDQWMISTLDDKLDIALNGGIHSGYLTEITGERLVNEAIFEFLTSRLTPSQRCRKDSISLDATAGCSASFTRWDSLHSSLHLNRSPTANKPTESNPRNPPETRRSALPPKTQFGPDPKHSHPRPRSPGAHPSLPSSRRNPALQRRPHNNRQHRRQLPRRIRERRQTLSLTRQTQRSSRPTRNSSPRPSTHPQHRNRSRQPSRRPLRVAISKPRSSEPTSDPKSEDTRHSEHINDNTSFESPNLIPTRNILFNSPSVSPRPPTTLLHRLGRRP